MALPSVSIRFRIFGGSAVLVALSLLLAGFGVWELAAIDGHVGTLVKLAEGSTRSVEVGQLLERTGRLALHYKATGNPVSKDGSDTARSAAIAMMHGAALETPSSERRELYQAVEAGLTAYQDMWNRGVGLLKLIREGRPRLLGDGDALSAALNPALLTVQPLNDPALDRAADASEKSVAALRMASLQFLIEPSAQGSEAFAAIADRTRTVLADFLALGPPGDTGPLIVAVQQALDVYAGTFAAQSGTILAANVLFDQTMRPLLEDLVARTAASQVSLRQDFSDTEAAMTALIGTTIRTEKIVGVAALLLGSLLAVLLGRGVIRPVAGMTAAMQKLAAGDTGVEIPSRDAHDEIGSMAKAVEIFRRNALDRIRLEAEQAELQERAAKEKRASMLWLADGFEHSVGGIVAEVAAASAEMERTAASMAALADRASAQAGAVAGAATEATGNVRAVAAATEELSSSIGEINQQVVRSTQMALQAVADAKRTDDTVTGLADGARRIGDVVSLIRTIASQTNLLALNATIEAARAGDAGKGFAVVASEVKGLAAQTAKATQDIASQIAAIQGATAEAVAAIQGIGAKIGQMNDVSTSIAGAIEQQSSATRAIAGSVGEATRGTESVSSNIAGVTDASGQVGAAASQVLRAAAGMSLGSARLRTEVADFLATLRAA